MLRSTQGLAAVVLVCALLLAHGVAAGLEADIPYVPAGAHAQQLDLDLPTGRGFDTILFVHGGSLNSEDRKDPPYPALAAAFRQRGVGVATMSYRHFPDHPWPAQPRDVASAFAWLERNIAARGGDPRRLFLVGHSSGARLVELVASDSTYLLAAGSSPRHIRGVVGMGSITYDAEFEAAAARVKQERLDEVFATDPDYRMFGDPATYRSSWARAHVHGAMPPILILVAEAEREQPPCLATGVEFAAAARRRGAWSRVEVLPDRDHVSSLEKLSNPRDPTLERILRFIRSPGTEK